MCILDSIREIVVLPLENVLPSLWNMIVVLGKRIIVAVVFILFATWLISHLRKLVKKLLVRKEVDKAVASFVNSLVNVGLKIVMVIVVISILGIETTSFAAILAAAGLAVGMAMKDNLSNFAGGVMLLLNKPFKLGDYILAQSMEGTITEIGILYTVLLTGDNRTVYLPNGNLSTGAIVNFSTQGMRRVDITLSMNNGTDIESLKTVLNDIVLANKKILHTPVPFVGITKLNNGGYDIVVRVWVLNPNVSGVTTSLNEEIYQTLSEKGFISASSLTVKLQKDSNTKSLQSYI